MAESPSDLSPSRTQPQSVSDPDSSQYWCYHCDKRVAIETLTDLSDVVCYECKNGFVESISSGVVPSPAAADPINGTTIGNEFIQVLRLIAQASRDQNAPPPPPSDPSDDDYLGIDFGGWDEEDEEEDDDERSIVVVHEEDDNREQHADDNRSEGEEEEENEVIEPGVEDEEEEIRRRRHDVLRLRLRDFATRAGGQRNRILDLTEILMGLEDHSIELRLQVPDSDTYVGNPGDYVDAAGYEALLQNLAESDNGARRGAPPASKSEVEKLENVVIGKEDEFVACAICKDFVNLGEMAKNLPCGHGYHGECIVTWLLSRNSCPVCRFELPTDDLEYEKERKKRVVAANSSVASASSSGSGNHDSGFQ